jgi:succinate dehydrogenase/fumarate reductase cytochrome b subunit
MQTDDIFTYGEETNPKLETLDPKFHLLESRYSGACLLASLRFGPLRRAKRGERSGPKAGNSESGTNANAKNPKVQKFGPFGFRLPAVVHLLAGIWSLFCVWHLGFRISNSVWPVSNLEHAARVTFMGLRRVTASTARKVVPTRSMLTSR